jgi:prepilin-type N-terminal cleavage/methylation domain-containing protein
LNRSLTGAIFFSIIKAGVRFIGNKMRAKKLKNKGFTLIELLVVIAIIGLIKGTSRHPTIGTDYRKIV